MSDIQECTAYEWCLEGNMRVLDLPQDREDWYYTEVISKYTFLDFIRDRKVKPNSTPRKTDLYLEYRMYGIVPYNISPIQSAIQFGHAVVEYGQNVKGMGKVEDIYNKWANEDKTFIILNGGTTNDNKGHKFYGTMQQHKDLFDEHIQYAEFREPDLNNALTAVVFLVDERVFNRDLYPDYVNMPFPWKDKGRGYKPSEEEMLSWEEANDKNREKWVEKIGGPANDFLRTHLRTLKLSSN